jgi:hypothetical protein
LSAASRLSLVHAQSEGSANGVDIRVGFELAGSSFRARFEVSGSELNVNRELATGASQWGLWDWDVVELFMTARGSAARLPYYEFQVSPLGQYFELEVLEPRVRTNRSFVSGFRHEAEVLGPDSWRATLEIPLATLGWDGQPASLAGGAFAMTGAKGRRAYWALNLPAQEKPDFHLPGFFRPFFGT